eukprot:GAHX01000571.1.p1 GENE.GAHX01000571.1~~GAHX01000571.1.p1  ORF type:complete len:329 (-),score=89.15 GAHX01000571.1:41-976(-)
MHNRLEELKRETLSPDKAKSRFNIFKKDDDNEEHEDEISKRIKQCQNSLNNSIEVMDKNINNLEKCADEIYTVINPEKEKELLENIKTINNNINNEMSSIRNNLNILQRDIEEIKKEIDVEKPSKTKAREISRKAGYISIIENVIKSAKTALAKRVDKFNQSTIKINEYQKRDIKKIVNTFNPDLDEEKIEEFLQETNQTDYKQYTKEEQDQINEAKQRKAYLETFEKNVAELLKLLSEMNNLVVRSSDILDSVEFNVASAKEEATNAKVQIDQALDAHFATRKCRMIFYLFILVIVGLIIWAIISLFRKK